MKKNESTPSTTPTASGLAKWPVPLVHLLASVVVVAFVGLLVYGLWFPSTFRSLAGGSQLFWLIIGVDVICGPFLTWLLFNPGKSRTALTVDLTLVVLIQLAALAYGVYTLSHARPLALVFEVDRFRLVSYADLEESDLANAPHWVRPWSFSEVRVVGTRTATTLEEKLTSVDASLQGIEPSQRPSWWQDYALSRGRVLQRARPLADLQKMHATKKGILDEAIENALTDVRAGETTDAAQLLWLPLVSRQDMAWVVLVDPTTARPRSYAPLDGF